MKTISLIGFQGAGFKENSPYANQPSLIRAGHVGMIFEGDHRIFGFRPTQKAQDDAGGEAALLAALKRHAIVDGAIFDDRWLFELASILSIDYERLTVWIWDQGFTDEQFDKI
ncbi:MAG: hypothetical protein SGI73_11590 [Chloroflexota bacterium]|nr:hypothetical protein [Chloroflexota bacterium]